jgi:L-aspartate semialdehyde sulfurtransferase
VTTGTFAPMCSSGAYFNVGHTNPRMKIGGDTLHYTAVTDADIVAQIVDYSEAYPNCVPGSLGEVTYAELKSGSIVVNGKKVSTAGLSSYAGAKEVAATLKQWIENGSFFLTKPVASLP